jgi:hypothetical protein
MEAPNRVGDENNTVKLKDPPALGTPASSTNKTGRHDMIEILLKVAFNTKK